MCKTDGCYRSHTWVVLDAMVHEIASTNHHLTPSDKFDISTQKWSYGRYGPHHISSYINKHLKLALALSSSSNQELFCLKHLSGISSPSGEHIATQEKHDQLAKQEIQTRKSNSTLAKSHLIASPSRWRVTSVSWSTRYTQRVRGSARVPRMFWCFDLVDTARACESSLRTISSFERS